MYIYIYVCIYIYNYICVNRCIHLYTKLYIYIYTHWIYIYVCVYTCTNICIIEKYIYIHICMCMHLSSYVYIYICVCVYLFLRTEIFETDETPPFIVPGTVSSHHAPMAWNTMRPAPEKCGFTLSERWSPGKKKRISWWFHGRFWSVNGILYGMFWWSNDGE